jgi:hypothetical protein
MGAKKSVSVNGENLKYMRVWYFWHVYYFCKGKKEKKVQVNLASPLNAQEYPEYLEKGF